MTKRRLSQTIRFAKPKGRGKTWAQIARRQAEDAALPPDNRGKYGERRAQVNSHVFDSIAEAQRYGELRLLEQAGEIADLELQPLYRLAPKLKRERTGKTVSAITYRADFAYRDVRLGVDVTEEVKGGRATETTAFRIRMRLWMHGHPERLYRLVRGTWDKRTRTYSFDVEDW